MLKLVGGAVTTMATMMRKQRTKLDSRYARRLFFLCFLVRQFSSSKNGVGGTLYVTHVLSLLLLRKKSPRIHYKLSFFSVL